MTIFRLNLHVDAASNYRHLYITASPEGHRQDFSKMQDVLAKIYIGTVK